MILVYDRVHFTDGWKNGNGAVNLNLKREYQLGYLYMCGITALRFYFNILFPALQQCFPRHKDNHERRLVKLLNTLLIV